MHSKLKDKTNGPNDLNDCKPPIYKASYAPILPFNVQHPATIGVLLISRRHCGRIRYLSLRLLRLYCFWADLEFRRVLSRCLSSLLNMDTPPPETCRERATVVWSSVGVLSIFFGLWEWFSPCIY